MVLDQRFFSMASLRILLSDRAADITGLQTVTATPPIDLARLAIDPAYRADPNGLGVAVNWVNGVPLALAGTYAAANGYGYRVPAGTPLADGFLKIERQTRGGAWSDVTVEILNRGFTGRNLANANAWNTAGTTCATAGNADDPSPMRSSGCSGSATILRRGSPSAGTRRGGGVVHARHRLPAAGALRRPRGRAARRRRRRGRRPAAGRRDALRRARREQPAASWLATHADTMDVTGYVVYFSDRRGNKNLGADGAADSRARARTACSTPRDDFGDDRETGELGFEDIINPGLGAERVERRARHRRGRQRQRRRWTSTAARRGCTRPPAPALPHGRAVAGVGAGGRRDRRAWAAGLPRPVAHDGRAGERRAGQPAGVLPAGAQDSSTAATRPARSGCRATATQGLSVVAENPLYVQGNYNAPDAAGTGFGTAPGTDHVSAAVIADAVTLLSNNFNDIADVHVAARRHAHSRRAPSTTTWYRMAVISGKGAQLPEADQQRARTTPTSAPTAARTTSCATSRTGTGTTLNYRGSIVSFYINRQAVGTYKCCDVVYSPPTRGYKFDTDFLTPALLPPRTPMFRDVNTLTFRQLLRPDAVARAGSEYRCGARPAGAGRAVSARPGESAVCTRGARAVTSRRGGQSPARSPAGRRGRSPPRRG